MKCMNCHVELGSSEGKLFAKVFVCPTCHEVAERLYRRVEHDLKACLTLTHDKIREYLTLGKLRVGPQEDKSSVLDRSELLKQLDVYTGPHDTPRQ